MRRKRRTQVMERRTVQLAVQVVGLRRLGLDDDVAPGEAEDVVAVVVAPGHDLRAVQHHAANSVPAGSHLQLPIVEDAVRAQVEEAPA